MDECAPHTHAHTNTTYTQKQNQETLHDLTRVKTTDFVVCVSYVTTANVEDTTGCKGNHLIFGYEKKPKVLPEKDGHGAFS